MYTLKKIEVEYAHQHRATSDPHDPFSNPNIPQIKWHQATDSSLPSTKGFDPTMPWRFKSCTISHPSHQTPRLHLFSISAQYISTSLTSSCKASNFRNSSASDGSSAGKFGSVCTKIDVFISPIRSIAAAISGISPGSLQKRQCLLGEPERQTLQL